MSEDPESGDTMDLTPVEVETLIIMLERGDDIPSNIAEHSDRHRKSVSRKLTDLSDRGFVTSKGGGVYALTPEGVLLAQALRREKTTS